MKPPVRKNNTETLNRFLKRESDIELPMDPAYYDRLHDKIMQAVAQREVQPQPLFSKSRKFLRSHFRNWLETAGLLTLFVIISGQITPLFVDVMDKTHTVQVVKNEKELIEEFLNDPDAISQTLISYQSQNDFFVDLAQTSFDDLSIEQMHKIMGEDRR